MKTMLFPFSCVKISRKTRELHALSKHENAGSLANLTGIVIAKGYNMKTIILNLFAALVLVAGSIQLHAQGSLVIDQESYSGPINPQAIGVDGLYVTDLELFQQSFVPTLSAIDYIAIEFEPGDVPPMMYVSLYEGAPSVGNQILLGTTATVTIPDGLQNNGLIGAGIEDFYFTTPITLTPGDEYYFQPHLDLGGENWAYVTMIDYYDYPNGQLNVDGSPYVNNTEMWFQEGVVAVPEPSTLALAGFSGLLVLSSNIVLKQNAIL